MGGWFKVDRELYDAILDRCGGTAWDVYEALLYEEFGSRENPPTIDEIAARCRVSADTVRRGLRLLVKEGFVEVTPEAGKANRYTFSTPHENATPSKNVRGMENATPSKTITPPLAKTEGVGSQNHKGSTCTKNLLRITSRSTPMSAVADGEEEGVPSQSLFPEEPTAPQPATKRTARRAPRTEDYSERFEAVWQAYPKCRREDKGGAWIEWGKAIAYVGSEEELRFLVLAALTWQIPSNDWTSGRKQFVPHLRSYLSRKRWKDERDETLVTADGKVLATEPRRTGKLTGQDLADANMANVRRRQQEREQRKAAEEEKVIFVPLALSSGDPRSSVEAWS